ncbi:MAG TPA: hypothetical protein VF789_26870 [Thermoanaerobaculia bacterium]
MSTPRVLWHLMRADFLERVRRYSFLVTLLLAVGLGYTVAAGHIKLWIADTRGLYNSAWVGLLMALVCNTFLALAGFYVVKSTVERDRRTGVGQILATTPMSKPLYTCGKALSNFAVLLAMVAVMVVMAVATQLTTGEVTRVEPWDLLSPFLFLTLPLMALVAATAVLFETVPGLRAGFGNVVWFFVWAQSMAVGVVTKGVLDPYGMGLIMDSLYASVGKALGRTLAETERSFILGGISGERQAGTFLWEGMDWTSGLVLARLSWVLGAVAVVLVAAVFFDRFDPARFLSRRRRRTRPAAQVVAALREGADVAVIPVHLHPLPAGSLRFRFLNVLRAELRLALKGQRWWWYAVAAGLTIAGFVAPLESARSFVLPFSWIWPVLLWSALGTRESRHGTGELIFSAARPVQRQLPAVWLSGVILAMATGGAVAVRLAMAGDWAGFGGWAVGALFIPTLALALGVWSGTSKVFEAVYLLIWYVGPLNRTPALDFMGSLPKAVASGMPLVFLAITAALGTAAVAGRKRQLQMR